MTPNQESILTEDERKAASEAAIAYYIANGVTNTTVSYIDGFEACAKLLKDKHAAEIHRLTQEVCELRADDRAGFEINSLQSEITQLKAVLEENVSARIKLEDFIKESRVELTQLKAENEHRKNVATGDTNYYCKLEVEISQLRAQLALEQECVDFYASGEHIPNEVWNAGEFKGLSDGEDGKHARETVAKRGKVE